MKKLMFATIWLACMFAITGGNGTSQAAAAAPTVAAPEVGTCRWFCGSSTRPYASRTTCEAACSTVCEAVC